MPWLQTELQHLLCLSHQLMFLQSVLAKVLFLEVKTSP